MSRKSIDVFNALSESCFKDKQNYEAQIKELKSEIESYEATLKAVKIQRDSKTTSLIWLWKYVEADKFSNGMYFSNMVNSVAAKNVTFRELDEFLKADDTEKRPYNVDNWNCTHISVQLHNRAEAKGIRCGILEYYWVNEGHAINVFLTTDLGYVFADLSGGGDMVMCDVPGFYPDVERIKTMRLVW